MNRKLKTETLYTRFPGCSPREVVPDNVANKLLEALEACHRSMMLGCSDVEAQLLFDTAISIATEEK
jgi:hypothetical protein